MCVQRKLDHTYALDMSPNLLKCQKQEQHLMTIVKPSRLARRERKKR